jgi:2-C-methyl-D-erythritol 4-phosphate cytidylyltransferase
MNKNKTTCVILAAGNSSRFQENKLFIKLSKKSLLYTVVDKILSFEIVGHIIIVVSLQDIKKVKQHYRDNAKISIILGGETRMGSIYNGALFACKQGYLYTYVHDAARPVFTRKSFIQLKNILLNQSLEGAVTTNKIYDSLVIKDENMLKSVQRDKFLVFKTPHLYVLAVLMQVLLNKGVKKNKHLEVADLFLLCKKKLGYVEGDISNIKVTYKEDIKAIKKLL